MKRLMRILGICLLVGALASPQFDSSAQGRRPGAYERNDRGGNRGGHNNGGNRGNHNQRPNHGGNQGGNHDGNQGGGNQYQRPNHGGNHDSGNNYQRPNHGGNHDGNQGGNHGGYRPTPPPPGHHGGGYRPTPPPPPARPHRPHIFWSNRPAPPPAFRPHYHLTPFQAIFGFAVGTAFNASLNYLYANNYVIDGYSGNELYLRNVNAFNMIWPDAVLTYNNGYLSMGNFSYSTSYYDSSRYNLAYRSLCNNYGAPVSIGNGNNGLSATWWGYDNRYITLDYRPYYAVDGTLRYYTTLTIG